MESLPSSYYPPPHYPPHHSHPPPPGVAPHPPPQASHPHPLAAPQPYQYHYDYFQHQQPAPPPSDELRTLFIAGLPDDVKSREIYNLFRGFPGYESCQVRCNEQSSKAFAFAVFSNQHSAVAAMHALNGMVFDLEKESTLHMDLAKSNSWAKRQKTDDGWPGSGKKGRGSSAGSRDFPDTGLGSNTHIAGMVHPAHSTNGYTSTQSHLIFDYGAIGGAELSKSASAAHVPQTNPPCRTLFVANLSSGCSELELIQLFSRCPGFLKLKLQKNRGVPVAFIDFKDEASSTGALNLFQGVLLYSSAGEGIRLEYAKAQMGLKKRERS